jgi:hypothetical protein
MILGRTSIRVYDYSLKTIICRKITSKNDTEKKLQKDLDTLLEWAVENWMKINPGKSKAIRFTRARVKNSLGYTLGDQKIPEASNCKYLGNNPKEPLKLGGPSKLHSAKIWKAFHFVMRVFKKGNRCTKF